MTMRKIIAGALGATLLTLPVAAQAEVTRASSVVPLARGTARLPVRASEQVAQQQNIAPLLLFFLVAVGVGGSAVAVVEATKSNG